MTESLDISIQSVKNYLDHSLETSCSNRVMDARAKKYANRRARLKQLIQEKAESPAAFARQYGYTRSQIGQYISATYNDGRNPGEGAIEKLEDRVGLPPGYFDISIDGPTAWPFGGIDEIKVRQLSESNLLKLEAAILIAAAQVGMDIKKDG